MVHPLRRQTIIMSILLEFDENDEDNHHLQKAIDEWQKVYDENEAKCSSPRSRYKDEASKRESRFGNNSRDRMRMKRQRKRRNLFVKNKKNGTWDTKAHGTMSTKGSTNSNTAKSRFINKTRSSNYVNRGTSNYEHFQNILNRTTANANVSTTTKALKQQQQKADRNLGDKTPFGRGGWDPFHPSLETTIYHWGYWGSLTDPPCSTFVVWRVLTKPAYISKGQLDQMKRILFTNRDYVDNYKPNNDSDNGNENNDAKKCQYTSVHYNESVARPIQPNRGRNLHKCNRNDYVSDKEKARMREKTGNPNWCC